MKRKARRLLESRRSALGFALGFALALALWLAVTRPVAAADAVEFTADERARLEAGQLVVREAAQRRGDLRLLGGTAYQVVKAPPDIVWQALLDTSHYQRMLPELSEAEVIEEHGGERLVRFLHGSPPVSASYYLSMKINAAKHDIAFRLDETRERDIRAAWGFYTVRPHANGRALVIFGVLADPGDGLLRTVMRPAVQEWVMRVPWMVKRFVEGSGRYLYH